MNIRPVNLYMAACAALHSGIDHAVCRRVRHGDALAIVRGEIARARVALQAQLAHRIPGQQSARRRPVRLVAGDAAIRLPHLVLKQERALLIDMALYAGLVAARRHVEHLGSLPHAERRRKAAVRIVAVCALHEPFVNPVLGRHVEQGAHIVVARVTELGLRLRQQIPVARRMVIGVAGRACDVVLSMLGTPNIGAVEVL